MQIMRARLSDWSRTWKRLSEEDARSMNPTTIQSELTSSRAFLLLDLSNVLGILVVIGAAVAANRVSTPLVIIASAILLVFLLNMIIILSNYGKLRIAREHKH